MKQKKKKVGLLGMLLGTLAASLLENTLAAKGVVRVNEGVIRASQYFWCHLILWELLIEYIKKKFKSS